MDNSITLSIIDNEPRIDSRIVAKGINIEHRAFMQTLRKYQEKFNILGGFVISNAETPPSDIGGRPETYVMLNENQVTFAVTLSRNTDQVVDFKLALVQAFSEARKQLESSSKEQNTILIGALGNLANQNAQFQHQIQQSALPLTSMMDIEMLLYRLRQRMKEERIDIKTIAPILTQIETDVVRTREIEEINMKEHMQLASFQATVSDILAQYFQPIAETKLLD